MNIKEKLNVSLNAQRITQEEHDFALTWHNRLGFADKQHFNTFVKTWPLTSHQGFYFKAVATKSHRINYRRAALIVAKYPHHKVYKKYESVDSRKEL